MQQENQREDRKTGRRVGVSDESGERELQRRNLQLDEERIVYNEIQAIAAISKSPGPRWRCTSTQPR